MRTIGLAWGFTWRSGFVVPLVLAAGGFAVWTILTSGGQQATRIAGALGAGAAALGVTWKGTKATLGQAAVKLEQPLWEAELDTAIGSAITTLEHRRLTPSIGRLAAEVAPQGPAPASDQGARHSEDPPADPGLRDE